MFPILLAAAVMAMPVPAGERPVAPYAADPANAGATPFAGDAMWRTFHGTAGVDRIVESFVARITSDTRVADVFRGHDLVRLRRTLAEQFCYILNGGCVYSGRSMADAHRDLGSQTKDMNAVVEDLQLAMAAERVPFPAQNRLLAKLAPMKRAVVER